jgi:hypothetical protein
MAEKLEFSLNILKLVHQRYTTRDSHTRTAIPAKIR